MSDTTSAPRFPVMNALFGGRPSFTSQIANVAKLVDDADDVMDDWRNNNDPNGEALVAATQAAALATVALAEQQRIANLIAWQALTGESNRAEIRKGLEL